MSPGCRRAYGALLQFTRRTIAELQTDDDEILRGVDWSAVACTADMCKAVQKVLKSSQSDKVTVRNDGGRSARQSSELAGSMRGRHQKSKAALGAATGQSSLLSEVYSSTDDGYFGSEPGSSGQQGFGGSSDDQNPASPMFLTRANLAAASSRTSEV